MTYQERYEIPPHLREPRGSYASQLAPIIHSPHLPEMIEQLQKVWAEEQQKRQDFYNSLDEDSRSEFINGEIITHSPARIEHGDASSNLVYLLQYFIRKHKLGKLYYENYMIRLTRNDYEPDIIFYKKEKANSFPKNMLLFPTPDFVVEILSDSTANRDRGVKMADYERHGVEEYWIVDAEVEVVEQYVLREGVYFLQTKASNGSIESEVLKGFSVPVKAVFDSEQTDKAYAALQVQP